MKEIIQANRKQLINDEEASKQRLVQTYQNIATRLSANLNALLLEVDFNNNPTTFKVSQLNRYQTLLSQIRTELNTFGNNISYETNVTTTKAIELGTNNAQQLTGFLFNNVPEFTNIWNRLPVESIQQLLKFLDSNGALHTGLVNDLGSNAAQLFEDKFLEGIALGYNPVKIARLAETTLNQPLHWALQTIRTAQLYSYREATRANFAANADIVEGWIWFATLDLRVCLSCVSKHGQRFDLDTRLNDHHNGRCNMLPMVKPEFNVINLQVQSGKDWINKLTKAQQLELMGEGKYDLFKRNKLDFNSLSVTYKNDIYGDMLREATLAELKK